MSTLGNTTTPLSGWDNPGSGYGFATSFTTPSGGGILISDIHAYFDTTSGSPTGYVCVWNNSGTLLASASVGTLSVKTGGVGNPLDWHSASITPLYVGPSTAIWIGGYSTGSLLFNSESGGSSSVKSMGGSGPGSFASHTSSGIGGAGAYVDYTLAGGYVRRSSSWVAGEAVVRRSSAWTAAEVTARRSSAWNPTS